MISLVLESPKRQRYIPIAIIYCTLLCFEIMDFLRFLRAAAKMQDQSVFSLMNNDRKKAQIFCLFLLRESLQK